MAYSTKDIENIEKELYTVYDTFYNGNFTDRQKSDAMVQLLHVLVVEAVITDYEYVLPASGYVLPASGILLAEPITMKLPDGTSVDFYVLDIVNKLKREEKISSLLDR